QGGLTVNQRGVAQVVTIEVQKIESKERQVSLIVGAERLLQSAKARSALIVQHHDFAVERELFRGQRLYGGHKPPEPIGPVLAPPGQHARATAVPPAVDAVAIQLDLVDPIRSARRAIDGCRELRRDESLEGATPGTQNPRVFRLLRSRRRGW